MISHGSYPYMEAHPPVKKMIKRSWSMLVVLMWAAWKKTNQLHAGHSSFWIFALAKLCTKSLLMSRLMFLILLASLRSERFPISISFISFWFFPNGESRFCFLWTRFTLFISDVHTIIWFNATFYLWCNSNANGFKVPRVILSLVSDAFCCSSPNSGSSTFTASWKDEKQ